jgi:hypothetical protein
MFTVAIHHPCLAHTPLPPKTTLQHPFSLYPNAHHIAPVTNAHQLRRTVTGPRSRACKRQCDGLPATFPSKFVPIVTLMRGAHAWRPRASILAASLSCTAEIAQPPPSTQMCNVESDSTGTNQPPFPHPTISVTAISQAVCACAAVRLRIRPSSVPCACNCAPSTLLDGSPVPARACAGASGASTRMQGERPPCAGA